MEENQSVFEEFEFFGIPVEISVTTSNLGSIPKFMATLKWNGDATFQKLTNKSLYSSVDDVVEIARGRSIIAMNILRSKSPSSDVLMETLLKSNGFKVVRKWDKIHIVEVESNFSVRHCNLYEGDSYANTSKKTIDLMFLTLQNVYPKLKEA